MFIKTLKYIYVTNDSTVLVHYTAIFTTEKKIEGVLGEKQFGFRRGKRTRDAIGMMRIIAERPLEIDEELRVCFIDWQKSFDRVD